MKRYATLLLCMAAAVASLTSCLKSDADNITLYDEAALSSFSLSTSLRLITTGDTAYYVKDSGVSAYAFVIDQLNDSIFNPDSILYGTDPTRLLCAYTTVKNGQVIKWTNNDSVGTLLLTTDTMDFSRPRRLTVISSSGLYSRDYWVKVNIHQQQPEGFDWKAVTLNNDEVRQLQGMKAVELNGKIFLFGQHGGQTECYTSATTDGTAWQLQGRTFSTGAWKSIVSDGQKLYLLDGGIIYCSADGSQWTQQGSACTHRQLLGATTKQMFALGTDGRIQVSRDKGLSWEADSLLDSADRLPAEDVNCVVTTFKENAETEYVLLAGNPEPADTATATARVWRKLVDNDEDSAPGKWVDMTVGNSGVNTLPRLKNLCVTPYDDGYLALGQEGMGGSTAQAYGKIYQSRDMGITWKTGSYVYPEGFDKTATHIATFTDSQNYLWIFCAGTGQIWRGRLNRLGWK